MLALSLLAQVDPKKALHDAWNQASPEVHIGTGGAGFTAWLAGVNWAAVGAFIGVAIPILCGVLSQCWRQIQEAKIKVREAQIESDDRIAARRAASLPPPPPFLPPTDGLRVLVPDSRASG